jgi:hypothetical protein
VFGVALGDEDLNDHERLRLDSLLAVLLGKSDPTGQDREAARDKGKPLASSSTLNRLELTPPDASAKARYKKIVADPAGMDRLLVACFLQAYATPPPQIWIDLDATDDPIHGQQEGRFFHGYYRHYCYLPLSIFSGEHLLCARLRQANGDTASGSVEELERIFNQIRQQWPHTEILVRGDSGFCREQIMAWCETNGVAFVLGLAKNERLKKRIADALDEADRHYHLSGQAARVLEDFPYRTRKSWSQARRVIAKAEHLSKGANPRFVVTSLSGERADARTLTMRANQIRLYFSSFAYVLLCALRRLGLQGTVLARAQCGSIRLKLSKIGAQIRVSVRRVYIAFSESYPWAALFRDVLQNLCAPPPYPSAP